MAQLPRFNDGFIAKGDLLYDINNLKYEVCEVDHSTGFYVVEWEDRNGRKDLQLPLRWGGATWPVAVGREDFIIWDENQGYCHATFGPSERPF